MGMNQSLSAYADVRAIFDRRLAREEDITVHFSTRGKAIRWRQRAYYFRTLLRRQQQQEFLLQPDEISTPYDGIVLKLQSPDELAVIVSLESFDGLVRDSSGTVLDISQPPALRREQQLIEDEDTHGSLGLHTTGEAENE